MFNHAIVYVPGALGGEDLWIDATAEYARVGTLPAQDANRLALVIRAGDASADPHAGAALGRQPPDRDARILPRPNTARRASSKPPRRTAPSKANTAPGTPAPTPRRASTTSRPTCAMPIAPRQLVNYEHTASDDFSKPYSMSLEMKDAPVGFTDLETAAVGVNVANITVAAAGIFRRAPGRQRRRRRSRCAHRGRGVRTLRHRMAIPHPAAAGISAARRCRPTMC